MTSSPDEIRKRMGLAPFRGGGEHPYGDTQRCTNPEHGKHFPCRSAKSERGKYLTAKCNPTPRVRYSAAEIAEAANRGRLKPWRAPKLTQDGLPFELELGEVGSAVVWTDYEPVRSLSGIPTGEVREVVRSGQVWSLAHPIGREHAVVVVTEAQEAVTLRVSSLRPVEQQVHTAA